MFCSKCGAEIKDNDKFCPKCGHTTSGASSSEDDKKSQPGAPVPARTAGCSSCFFIFLLLFSIGLLIAVISFVSSGKNHNNTELIIGSSLFFVVFFALAVWGLIHNSRKNRRIQAEKKIETKEVPKPADSNVVKKPQPASGWTVFAIIIVFVVIFFVFIWPYFHRTISNVTTDLPGVTSSSWDGYYPTTEYKPNCDSPIELTAFSVADEAVANLYGQNAPIASDGTAKMDMGSMVVYFTFTKDGVSGSWSSGKCSGTFKGSKQW